MPAGQAVVKLDFANAFNSLNRSAMLAQVYMTIPELYRFCHLSYNNPSDLRFDKWCIQSQEGIQQGDPLGPLLFCLTIHPLLSSLTSPLRVSYLDDITLGGGHEGLEYDIQRVIDGGQVLGLH